MDRGGCHAWSRVCLLYLEHLVPLPILEIIICPFLDYYNLSIFHNLGSPLIIRWFLTSWARGTCIFIMHTFIHIFSHLSVRVLFRHRNPGLGYDTLLLRLTPGDLYNACPHRQFNTLLGLLDSLAAPTLMLTCQAGWQFVPFQILW